MNVQRVLPFVTFALIPLLGGNHLALSYVTIDRFWIETSFLILLIASILLQYRQRRSIDPQFKGFLLFFLPFLGITAASVVYTWNRLSSLNELNVLVWATGAVYLYASSLNKKDLLKGLVLGGVLLSLCAIVQLKILFPELANLFREGKYALIAKSQAVPFSAFTNPNMLGGYFLWVLPVALFFGLFRRKPLYLVASVIITAGIFLSLSRLAMIMTFLLLIALLVVCIRLRDVKGLLMLAGTVASAIVLFFLLIYGDGRQGRDPVQRELEGKVKTAVVQMSSMHDRTEIWKFGLRAFFAKPVFGYGAGTFEYGYRKYFDGRLYTKYSHGALVKVAVELGVLGLISFFLYALGFLPRIRPLATDPERLCLSMAALSGFLFALLDFSLDVPAHVVTFFVLSSLFLVQRPPESKGYAAGATLCLVLLSLLASFAFTARVDLSRKAIENGVAYEENGFSTEAYLSYRDAIESMPINNESLIKIVGLLMNSYKSEQDEEKKKAVLSAIRHYLSLIESTEDRDAELLFTSGKAYAMYGKGEGACSYMDQALAYYPSSAYYASEAAACYYRSGSRERALALIRSAERYSEAFKSLGNPQGLFVYKIRDLESEVEYGSGHGEKALMLARKNLSSAEKSEFVITDSKAREFIQKESLLNYLRERVSFYEAALKSPLHVGHSEGALWKPSGSR